MQQGFQCPNCGSPVMPGAKFCGACGAPLHYQSEQNQDAVNAYTRAMMWKAFQGILFAGFVIILIWALLLKFLPDGWWITVISIGGFILTIFIIGFGCFQTLRTFMHGFWAFILGLTIWFVMAVLIRSLILELLGVI